MTQVNLLLIGQAGTGKGAVAKILCQNYSYVNYSLSAWLKETINKHYGLINPSKSDIIDVNGNPMTYRRILQLFGTETIRNFDNNWHLTELFNEIDDDGFGAFVIDDVRFLNEVLTIAERYAIITIRVKCDEDVRVTRLCERDSLCPDEEMNIHVSETELDEFEADYVIDNSGNKHDLEQQIKNIMGDINE